MVIKKADIYFNGDVDLRVTIIIEGNIDDNFCQIAHAVEKYGNGQKLQSIYFREEETR